MKLKRMSRAVTALAGCLLLVLTLGSAALANDVRVDVVINGERLEDGAIVYGDRTYVHLEDVARLLDGRFVHDPDANVAFVLTGRYKSLMADTLAKLNPDLDGYTPIARFVSGRGIHYGMPMAHVTISFLPSGLAAAFSHVMTAGELKHEPWFDQTPGKFERFFAGDGYSQHLYVVERSLIQVADETRVAFNGRALKVDPAEILVREGGVLVSLRALAEATGGGVGWDVAERLATAKIQPGDDLTWNTLASLNMRTIRFYDQQEPVYVPSIGYRHVTPGQGLIVGTEEDERITVFGALFPAETTEWFPWFDQSHGEAPEFPDAGRAYSQHIYLVDKEQIGF